jgi:PleD family two-component response regulator
VGSFGSLRAADFSQTAPVALDRAPIAAVREGVSTMTPTRRILIVDDDAVVLEVFTRILRDDGFDVLSCPSAREALQELRVGTFDLIISDMNMPGETGLHFA